MGSLRVRLIAGALLWILAGLTAAGIVVAELFRQHVERQFYAELESRLDEVASVIIVDPEGEGRLERPLSDPRFNRPYSGYYWLVEGDDGTALRSRSLWDFTPALARDNLSDGRLHRHQLAGPTGLLLAVERRVQPAGSPTSFVLVVAANQSLLDRVVIDFTRTLFLSLATFAASLVGAAILQVLVGLRPLRYLRASLNDVRAGRTAQLGGNFPLEVQPLVDDLNALIRHNADMLVRARTQAGNLAHSLRTSLAILDEEARRIAARGGVQSAEVLRQHSQRMQRQIDHHIARARAAAARIVPGMVCPLAPSIASLVQAMKRLHADRQVTIDVDVQLSPIFAGDEQDLSEMLGNLLDNACKWARARIAVSSRSAEDQVIVMIDDDGPGLPPEARERVFGVGERLDERVPGSGLGLAIVRDLAGLYGGHVHLEQAPLGGLRAVLVLPAAGVEMPPTGKRSALARP